MKPLILALIVIAVLAVIAISIKNRSKKTGEIPRAKQPVTKNEQAMFFRLTSALPEHVVLAQVSFSSLLTAKTVGARNTFDRKTADFVICTKSFDVIAVIELDDSSHKGREIEDGKRDLLLTNAGYKVLRYKQIPDLEKVKADFIVKPQTEN
jgi:very-short-patch-repair endonuclease